MTVPATWRVRGAGRALAAAAVLATIAVPALAQAAPSGTTTGTPAGGPPPRPPLELPGEAGIARAGGWIVGGRPGGATARIARRHGGRAVLPAAGIYRVPASAARGLAADLRRAGRLSFAEADVPVSRERYPSDPLTPEQWWLPAVADPSLTPPPVTSTSPVLGVVDSQPDLAHPDLVDGNVTSTSLAPFRDEHGTAVSGLAGAPANGRGIVGLWPGMRVLVSPDDETCSSTVAQINTLVEAEVSVINMSYGYVAHECHAHYIATQYAFGANIVPVASGGNEFEAGNQPIRPAVDPHVVSVAATNRDDTSAYFSSENDAIDLAAPGTRVLTTVPPTLFAGKAYDLVDGTSFSSPIVAAALTWVRAERPQLTADQAAEVVRRSTRDLGRPGWDQRFGFGLLSVGGALEQPAPRADRAEPNDDIEWVNGKRFQGRDPSIFRPGQARATMRARVDKFEDPVDVWRMLLPARGRVQVKLRPSSGDPDLKAFGAGTRTVFASSRLLGRSFRPAGKTENLKLYNRRRGPATVYVAVYVDEVVRQLDSGYRLDVIAR